VSCVSPGSFGKASVLEGRDGDSDWIVVAKRINNSDLKWKSKLATFSVSRRQIYRQIRIGEIGPNDSHEFDFDFRAQELFGRHLSRRCDLDGFASTRDGLGSI
jgi:hypothetical protein